MVSMKSMDKTRVKVDHFLPCDLEYFAFAIPESAQNPKGKSDLLILTNFTRNRSCLKSALKLWTEEGNVLD